MSSPIWLRRALLAVSTGLVAAGVQAAPHETLKLDAPKPLLAPTPPMG